MLNFIAKRYAKNRYVFSQLVEAATNDLNAGLALRTATEKHKLAAELIGQADQMEARIKEMDAKLETGFWECENGHEHSASGYLPGPDGEERPCLDCGIPAKFIKRDQMTGQEKYESDKERKDAEDLAKQKRDQAKAEEENAAQSEKTAKYMQTLAQHNRSVAEKVRRI